MKKTTLFITAAALLATLGTTSCSSQKGITWAEGYEKCSIKLVAEDKLVLGLSNVAFAALPGNTALTGGVEASPIFREDKPEQISAKANIIAARTEDYANNTTYANKINALCAVLARESTKTYINETFSGKVISAYENLTNFTEETNGNIVASYVGTGTIKVAASTTPHAVILNHIKDEVKSDYGYDLEVLEMNWAVQNKSLSHKQADGTYAIDANYFQHVPYLESFEPESGDAALSAIVKVHYEPLGVYKGKKAKEDTIYNGADIEICNDPSNAERALQLLQDKGYIVSYDLKALKLA